MTYPDGTEIRLGDHLRLAGRPGRVVFSLDTDEFSAAYPKADWAYLKSGVMVEIDGIGLILLQDAAPDLEFLHRG